MQDAFSDLQNRGIGLAAISYDDRATLKAFADARGIAFPLLSDAGSATIRRYNLLNAAATGKAAGVPHPGTFVLDRRGIVTARSFEERYTDRATAGSLLARSSRPDGTGARIETAHLTVSTAVSDARVAPGTRLSLLVDVAPKPRMHVYAPEQKDVIPISVTLEPGEFTVHPQKLPKAETYFFKPLNETQLVYSAAFRVVQDVTIALTPALRERARQADAAITIRGTLRYQACDDAICYLPVSVPLTWTVGLKPLER